MNAQPESIIDAQANREPRLRRGRPRISAQMRRQSAKGVIILAGIEARHTLRQMGDALGVTREAIRQYIQRMGIDYRDIFESRLRPQRQARQKATDERRAAKAARYPTIGLDGKHSPEYRVYRAMLQRCYNPKTASYPSYGGRGVTVCDDWSGKDGWQHFIRDMGRRPEGVGVNGRALYSIDRINNVPLYSKETCRWATSKEQCAPTNRHNPILGRTTPGHHTRCVRRNSTSGCKGVRWNKKDRRWRVQITHGGRTHYVGQYRTLLEAARAYDNEVIKLFGPGAVTNASLGLSPTKKSVQGVHQPPVFGVTEGATC
jgi:hypothetical protein